MYTVFVKGNLSISYRSLLSCLIVCLFFFCLFFYFFFCFIYNDLSFGTLSLIIHLLVHYDASVYAPMCAENP